MKWKIIGELNYYITLHRKVTHILELILILVVQQDHFYSS